MHNHILCAVAHHHEKAPFFLLHAISNERRNARIDCLARHYVLGILALVSLGWLQGIVAFFEVANKVLFGQLPDKSWKICLRQQLGITGDSSSIPSLATIEKKNRQDNLDCLMGIGVKKKKKAIGINCQRLPPSQYDTAQGRNLARALGPH